MQGNPRLSLKDVPGATVHEVYISHSVSVANVQRDRGGAFLPSARFYSTITCRRLNAGLTFHEIFNALFWGSFGAV